MECHQQCSVWLPATIGMAFSPLRWLSSFSDIELLRLANMCENSRNPAVRNTSMFILPTIYNNGEKREKKDVDAKEAKEQGFFTCCKNDKSLCHGLHSSSKSMPTEIHSANRNLVPCNLSHRSQMPRFCPMSSWSSQRAKRKPQTSMQYGQHPFKWEMWIKIKIASFQQPHQTLCVYASLPSFVDSSVYC